jgi:hypothetical protein
MQNRVEAHRVFSRSSQNREPSFRIRQLKKLRAALNTFSPHFSHVPFDFLSGMFFTTRTVTQPFLI